MTPDEYLLGFVIGNWTDFQANPESVRHAFNAAVAAAQMAEHYYEYSRVHTPAAIADHPDFRAYLEYVSGTTDGAFADIRSIALAYKHLYPSRASCSVASTGAIEAVTIGGPEIDEVRQDYVPGESSKWVVRYTTKDGTVHDFASVLQKVVEFWEAEVRNSAGGDQA